MTLDDILPIEKWMGLEEEINKRYGLNASVFDADGIRITNFQKWANRLCPVIKANAKGQSFICAVAHQNIASEARKKRKWVIEECDAGLVKIAVPIFADDQFLGVAGGCGLLRNDEQVDTFLVNKITGIEVAQQEDLSQDIETVTSAVLESVAKYIEAQLEGIQLAFEKQRLVVTRKQS
ncbi:MAG: PocR ligand-binding domain-containing protein [Desulfobacterales bacterium]|nr:MAG: PocR ligand-binding domain-containing protein [Desulfobacterales bacterium]